MAPAKKSTRSMPKAGKDPKGGLTAAGRAFFKQKEGSNLRPGVRGPADTPEKMLRKGSFLRRHYANPRGPVKDAKGEPTRQALQAAAWGEAVPKTAGDERKLADKGKQLLERYHNAKGDGKSTTGSKHSGRPKKKSAGIKTSSVKSAAKKQAGGNASPAKASRRAASRSPAKKRAAGSAAKKR